MRPARTLWLYVMREILQYASLGFLAFALILVSNNVVRHLDLLIAVQFALPEVMQLIACLFAMFAPLSVPMALLFGILLGIGRLSADSEITAMRASGLGLAAIQTPTLLLAIAISAASAYLMIEVEPAAHRQLRATKISIASRSAFIEPQRFQQLGDRVVFVRSVDDDNQLEGVIISDRSDPARAILILAERGRLSFDAEKAEAHLLLEAGEIHLEPEDGDEQYRRWSFESFDYALDMSQYLEDETSRRPKEMTFSELRGALARAAAGDPLEDLRYQNPVRYELQLHKRLALPVAPIIFALLGVPLGLRRGRGARASAALICVVLLFVYYTLLSSGEQFAEEGKIPASVGLWAPNLLFALASLPLLRRAARGWDS